MTDGKLKLLERIKNDFTYHRPPEQTHSKFASIREVGRTLATLMVSHCPEGRELSTALTRLEEAVFHANAAIARQYPASTVP